MKKPLIYLILLFFILFLFELINGFWFRSPLEKILLNLNVLYSVDIQINPNDYYPSNKNISYSRNKYGLRTNCQNTKDINLVSIGGSTTDQRYIDFENTFAYILQEEISKNSGTDFCVANAGVDGHRLVNHINSFDNWFPLIPSFNPNYYLLNVGINDAVILNDIPKNNVTSGNSSSITFDEYPMRYNENKVYHEEFLSTIPSDNVLKMNICDDGDGWEKLCKFLNKEIPNIEFPYKNKV